MEDLFVRWGRQTEQNSGSSKDDAGRAADQDGGSGSGRKKRGIRVQSKDSDKQSKAVLAGCCTDLSPEKHARAMSELRGLADACGLEVVSTVVQNAAQITHATYIGSGKVLELKREIEGYDADIVIFNEALTPMQMRNLEKELDTEVLDRTGLILQIFASRARTREAKLQVESAQLQYMLPRLVGMRASLSRQGGGSGRLSNKGAGEQKLELDRRRIEKRIAELRRELEIVERERTTQRNRRLRTGLTKVALVGYTNAGKSTVMNALLNYCGTKGMYGTVTMSGTGFALQDSGMGNSKSSESNERNGNSKNDERDGFSGSNGRSGNSKNNGRNGFSGSNGRNGNSKNDERDGFSGSNGRSGNSKNDGRDGFSGSKGRNGNSKSSGSNEYSESRDREGSKQVFEADMLFATLDTSVRRIDAPGHIPFLLSDTVGFVSDLPHALVKAFRSTLDEVRYADLLLEVVDFSDPDYREQIEVTAKTLEEIGAGNIPVVYLYNKTDLAMAAEAVGTKMQSEDVSGHFPASKSRPIPVQIPFRRGETLYLAAGKGVGIPDILTLIDSAMEEDRIESSFIVPYTKGGILQDMRRCGALLSEEYLPEGTKVRLRCRRGDARRFRSQLESGRQS